MKNQEETKPIEYEQISIQVPKQVMELLRFVEAVTGDIVKDYIERSVLDGVRADIDAEALISHEGLENKFLLKPIYKELLGSGSY